MRDARNEDRFEDLLRRYARLLRRAITRACPPSLGILTTDIEQDARIRLWRAIESEKELEDPASYVYRVGVTATIDAIRRVRARREEQLPDAGSPENGMHAQLVSDWRSAPDVQAERHEIVDQVRQSLDALADNRRRAVALHLQGLTLEEIGHLLGWSAGKARNLVYRGLHDLRIELRRRGIDYP
jgi:RNA polymerase sigma factor (sigma-70 family)